MTKRLFIAIPIEPHSQLLSLLTTIKNELIDSNIKWVEPNQFHLTLYFIGDVSDELLDVLKTKLFELTSLYKPFNISFSKLGCFGKKKEPKVIWLGIEENIMLHKLIHDVKLMMTSLGFETSKNEEIPHLTLGRVKYIRDVERFNNVIGNNKMLDESRHTVNSVIVYESTLSSKGAVYNCLEKVILR